MLTDIRRLFRNVGRSPASAVAALLTLVLTLGAGTSILAVVDTVLLTPAPFVDPSALVTLGEILPGEPASAARAVSYSTFEQWRERATMQAAMEASDGTHLTVTGLGAAERVHVTNVTPGFLPLLGIAPARGRMFDDNDLGQPVALATHTWWRTKLAADAAAIGRQIVLGGRAHTLIGVLPEKFEFPLDQVDLFRPLQLPPHAADPAARAGYRVSVIARLGGSVSAGALTATLNEVSRRASPPAEVVAIPISERIARGSRRTLELLAGAAAVAFVIGFANLAGLFLVRSIDRRREFAVRAALGARRVELAQQLLLEACTLVVFGMAGGVLLAWWLTPVLGRLALEPFGDLANRDVAMSWRVIGVAAAAASVCAALCALLPVFVASRTNVVDVLGRGLTPAAGQLRLRRVFVTGVIALTCVMLVSLSLVSRSLDNVLNVHPGFEPHGVLTAAVVIQSPNPARASFLAALHGALEARLGLQSVSVVSELPLTHDGGRRLIGVQPGEPPREVVLREAGTAYFEVMRIPILAGRAFDARDNLAAPLRVVVSQSLADRWFGSEGPIGHHISLGAGPAAPSAEIVGVAGDVKHRSLDAEGFWPTVYASAWQDPSSSMFVVVRSERSTADVVAVVREEAARLDPDVPVHGVRAMDNVVSASPAVLARRVLAAAFTGFALLAIALGGTGVFGVVAHDVASRRAEIALRLALGAGPMRILMRVVGQGASIVGAGVVAGAVLSIWVTRALSGFVFAISAFDPRSISLAAAVLVAVGAVAVLPAATRAARVDPVSVLRSD